MSSGKWISGIVGSGLAVAGMSLVGVGCGGFHDGALALSTIGLANFATNVFAGFTNDGLKSLWRSTVERPGRGVDENNVILRQLRQAQIAALDGVVERFNAFRLGARDFSAELRKYLAAEAERAKSLTAADLPEPTDAEADAIRRAAGDFQAALSARHGAGPALGRFRQAAEGAMLAELRAHVREELPPLFEPALRGGRDGENGYFDLFVRDAARRLRDDPKFEGVWQAEQTAAIRALLETIPADLAQALESHAATLKAYGDKLDAIAETGRSSEALLRAIARRLDDDRRWLTFNDAFAPVGWLRFAAFNRAIPFQGREAELAALFGFLNHQAAFRWWAMAGAGGAGKTRLALELALRAHVAGWRVGFLTRPFAPPAAAWRPDAPTLVIADYAGEHLDKVRDLALRLARRESSGPVVRLLLIERALDDMFWRRFFGTAGREEGGLRAFQNDDAPVNLPPMTPAETWALAQACPWRTDGRKLDMEETAFSARLTHIDAARRPLVAMLLADALVEGHAGFATLDDVLARLVERSRALFWDTALGAREGPEGVARPVGDACPADPLIAAATMAGSVDREAIDEIGQRLGAPIKADFVRRCARAIGRGSNEPPKPLDEVPQKRLDGAQPDLIGEYFALAALAGDPADEPPFPWLAEFAWRTDETAMAGFVRRARQNFPHHRALPQIEIVVPGVFESWWLGVERRLEEEPTLLGGIGRAAAWLAESVLTDIAAAAAFAQLAWFASGPDNAVVPFAGKDALARAALFLPRTAAADPRFREGLAETLYNTLNHAKQEGDLARRDALLDDLRALAAAHPADAAVREKLARGLVNPLNHAKQEDDLARRDSLLDDLRALAAAHPADPAVCENLAKGLYNTLNHAKQEGDLARRNALLDDLRALVADHPADPAVREPLARGLYNTLVYAKQEDDLARRDALLDDLRALAAAHPADPAVRENLAIGLVNTLNHAKQEGDLARRDALLDHLRALAAAHPADPAVREPLAMGLYDTLKDAKQEGDLARRDALLDDLRALAAAHPADPAVRENLAMGLYNTLNDAKQEDDLARRDALLDDLRALAAAHPADPAVREPLARGLVNTLNDAKQEKDLARRDALLDELRALAAAHPADPAVREKLAIGLVNTLVYAKQEHDLARRDALLDDLRALAADHPADTAVRERLARGLYNTLNDAKQEHDLARRDALLDHLRALAADHPADPAVRERLARGLYNTLNDAKQEHDLARRDALLDHLRALAAAHPADPAVRERLARGLYNTLNDAKQEHDLARRDALLDHLRALAAAHPADPAVRENLAKGLGKTSLDAIDEGEVARRAALLAEIEALAVAYPEDEFVRRVLELERSRPSDGA